MLNRLLRVNLTDGSSRVEEIPSRVLEQFVGGRGLGAYLLYTELKPGIDPLGPDNKIIFTTGPLAGTSAPGSSKYVVLTKSPLTGIYLMSISSRGFGPSLRKAGYAALVIEGKADSLSMLVIDDNRVTVEPVPHLKGMQTGAVEKEVLAGLERGFTCASIGPAGENLVRYAAVYNDGRMAGRGGAGAVLGSKNLKAIAARGTDKVFVARPEEFQKVSKEATLESRNAARTKEQLAPYGTAGLVAGMNRLGIMPGRNWQVSCVEADRLTGEEMETNYLVKSRRCPPCPVGCSKINRVHIDGNEIEAEGPEYETLYAFGTNLGVNDFGVVAYCDYLCDQLGLDTMSAGVTISFATECYERGLLTKEDTGIDLGFGKSEHLGRLLEMIATREGIGDLLAEGSKRAADRIGQGSEAFAMHAKGMELGGYDPRAVKGMVNVYACGPRGGCHHAGGRTVHPEISNGNRFEIAGKGELTRATRAKRVYMDTAVLCTFQTLTDKKVAELLASVTGLEIDEAALLDIGERISNLERAFNIREGLRRQDDTLPKRLLEETLPSGPAAGQRIELDKMLDDFYQACAWDLQTGIPTEKKLKELGILDLVLKYGGIAG